MANTFQISYYGIPLTVSNASLESWLVGNLPLKDSPWVLPARTWTGARTGWTFPVSQQKRPTRKLGQYFYPNGASRWSEAICVATKDQLTQFEPRSVATGTPLQFELQNNGKTIQTPLYCLPPKPLSELGNNSTFQDLYLINLVDERYYWQTTPTPEGFFTSCSSTWESLLDAIATALNIDLTIDSDGINPVYDQFPPEQFSEMYSSGLFENIALVFDAVLYNIGHVLVRNFDGTYNTYQLLNAASNLDIQYNLFVTPPNNQAPSLRSGGNPFSTTYWETNALRINSILPAQIIITFPRWINYDQNYESPRYLQQRNPLVAGKVYQTVTNLADLVNQTYPNNLDLPMGTTGTTQFVKTFHDTARAIFPTAPSIGLPTNSVSLKYLGYQIAADYIARKCKIGAGIDVMLDGIQDYDPDGCVDIEWIWSASDCHTRLVGNEWNLESEELLHGNSCPSSSQSSISSISSISSGQSSTSSMISSVSSGQSSTSSTTSSGSSGTSQGSSLQSSNISSGQSQQSQQSSQSCCPDGFVPVTVLVGSLSWDSSACSLAYETSVICTQLADDDCQSSSDEE